MFSCFFLGNPTNKTETGTACTWMTTYSKLPGPIIMIDQLEILSLRSNLLHSFLELHNSVAPFTSHSKVNKFGAENPISIAQLAHFDPLAINLTPGVTY
jgi:hypothetical protein